MNAQELIQSYQKSEQQKLEQDQQERQVVAKEAQILLSESCHIWLNGLMDDFELGEIQIVEHHWPNSFTISQPFTWHGAAGQVNMYWRSNDNYGLSHPSLSFKLNGKQRRFVNNSYEETIKLELPTNRRETFRQFFYYAPLGPVDAAQLGKILAKVQAEMTERVELDQREMVAMRENEIQNLKGRFSWRDDDLSEHFAQCMAKYPELADDWERLHNEHKAKIAQEKQEKLERRQAEAELQAAWQEEQDRLEGEAASKFKPCIIYRLEYGAQVQGDDQEYQTYTNTVYALDDKPDADGWYTIIRHGEMKRVKLLNIIRIDELICLKQSDVPSDYLDYPFATVVLHSSKFEDLSVGYLSIPPLVKRFTPPQDLIDVLNRGAVKG